MAEPLPSWLHTYGTPRQGLTRTVVLQVFKRAAEYGVFELWPAQIYSGAVECFEYKKSKASINEALRNLMAENIVERGNAGYRLVNGSARGIPAASPVTPIGRR